MHQNAVGEKILGCSLIYKVIYPRHEILPLALASKAIFLNYTLNIAQI
jgi:hypothetical protein